MAEVHYYLFDTGMKKNPDCGGKCIFLEVPYYKSVREMVRLLSKALARSHFLIKEGLPLVELNEAQDFSVRRIKISTFHPAASMRCMFGPKQYIYLVPTLVI
jgi:hypothetical protein